VVVTVSSMAQRCSPLVFALFQTDVAEIQEPALFCNRYRVSVLIFEFRDSTVQASLFIFRVHQLQQALSKPHM